MNARRRPRRRIEIYFILYLVALVFLLPSKKDMSDGASTVPSDIRLDMQPERVQLESEFARDSSGLVTVKRLDSVNIIRYTGDVSDLDVLARIEDVETGQVLTIEPGGSPTSMFAVDEDADRQAIIFKWRPDMNNVMPKRFRVTILGSGAPLADGGPNSSDASDLPAGLRVNGSAQFILDQSVSSRGATTTIVQGTRIDTLVIQQGGADVVERGEFWVQPGRDSIVTTPMRAWTNRISMGGADPMRDLRGLPTVTVDRSDAIIERYLDTAQQSLLISGRAPRSGAYNVTVTATRGDGSTASSSFRVVSVPLGDPIVPREVYPTMQYTIDPQLPRELRDVQAVLRIGDRVIAQSRQGLLRFVPAESDLGKVVSFERLVEGVPVGTAMPIDIVAFPAPEIRDVIDAEKGRVKKVIVMFYGDRNKNRPTLNVVDGNARKPRKLFGNIRKADPDDPSSVRWLEDFMVDRKSGSAPFTFKLQAIDQRGERSRVWSVD